MAPAGVDETANPIAAPTAEYGIVRPFLLFLCAKQKADPAKAELLHRFPALVLASHLAIYLLCLY